VWPNMLYLSLTTTLFPHEDLHCLLQAAAAAAKNMPKLRAMELWGRTRDERFMYRVRDRQHTILVPNGTMGSMRVETIQSWQRVVRKRDSFSTLEVEEFPLYESGQPYPKTISWRCNTITTGRQLCRRYEISKLEGNAW
jgi:hypothetical protein